MKRKWEKTQCERTRPFRGGRGENTIERNI
jgi:hypothetical protein